MESEFSSDITIGSLYMTTRATGTGKACLQKVMNSCSQGGEMPRRHTIGSDGGARGVLGTIYDLQMIDWLAQNSPLTLCNMRTGYGSFRLPDLSQ